MQKVSKAYQDSMKSSLRERAYIMLSFGLVNQEAQAKAKIEQGHFTYFSRPANVFTERENISAYATLEDNFTKVDGSMHFLPRENPYDLYIDTGITSEHLISEAAFELVISLGETRTDIKGLTVDFGENYPVDFDVVNDSGQRIEVRGNESSRFVTEEVLEDTALLTLRFFRMKNPRSRLRIYSILFGFGLVYYNKDVMSSSLESYVSPIGADVPQIDFTVTLKNYDKYFNVDNPKSAINFLETGQEMEIYYGYQLPNNGDIEWVMGGRLLCCEWESDDYTATIRCQDVFRNMDSEFYRGIYRSDGINYYDLAVEVLADAGIEDYYIDPALRRLYTKNPLPRVRHKEALQIIANACRCALSQTRLGAIRIKSSFVPKSVASVQTESEYSQIERIMDEGIKDEYATLASSYTTVDRNMFFLPRNLNGNVLNTGFVSAELSGADGTFEKNPVVTITQEVACMYYGVKLTFGYALPAEFIIRTYNDGVLVTEYPVGADEIERRTVIHNQFDDFDVMTIEFVRTAQPYNRIVLNNFAFGDITDFTMTRNDMTSSPKAIKQEQVKEVIVPCYSYQSGANEESLVSEEVTAVAGDIVTFFVGDPSYDYRVLLNGEIGGVTILEWGNYYVQVRFESSGTFRLEIFGYRYKITERYAVKSLNSNGRSIKWENPLVSDISVAADLAQWLGDYYNAGIEYEYDTRGNPELDVNDIIYQENDFVKDMKVSIYRQSLEFNQSFAGKVTTRRIGG